MVKRNNYDGCRFNIFLDEQNRKAVKIFLEESIKEAMSEKGYEDAQRFRQIEEGYGKEFSDLLVKKAKDPVVR